MESPPNHSVIDRDLRARMLAKRMLRCEVRTKMITSFTRIPRNRLAAMRRRLDLPASPRPLGRTRSSAMQFIETTEHRFESSAVAALLTAAGLIGDENESETHRRDRLAVGERLLGIYEYIRHCFPELEIDFEGLVLLRTSLRRREVIEIAYCAHCRCQIVVERFDRKHRICWFCAERSGEGSAGHELELSPALARGA